MTSQPCVSVVIPIYNCEDTLIETLESVLVQDLGNFEVVCVDDGSTDRSAYIVEQLGEGDPRVRMLSQKNAGAGAARNAGIEAACGEYIAFLDGDDRYEEVSYLRELYEGARENAQQVAAGCFVNWRGADDLERDFTGTEYDGYQFSGSGIVMWRDYQFDYGFHRFLFARELFEDGANRFGYLTYFEDPVFLVRILHRAGSFYATDRAHYLYRCEWKPRDWTTGAVLDFLEGAGQNLQFSRQHDLAKLHWYTLKHMEYSVWEMGIGVNQALALDVIDAKLARLETLIDPFLLKEAGETELPYNLRLRQALDSEASFDPLGGAYRWARYLWAHR